MKGSEKTPPWFNIIAKLADYADFNLFWTTATLQYITPIPQKTITQSPTLPFWSQTHKIHVPELSAGWSWTWQRGSLALVALLPPHVCKSSVKASHFLLFSFSLGIFLCAHITNNKQEFLKYHSRGGNDFTKCKFQHWKYFCKNIHAHINHLRCRKCCTNSHPQPLLLFQNQK